MVSSIATDKQGKTLGKKPPSFLSLLDLISFPSLTALLFSQEGTISIQEETGIHLLMTDHYVEI